MCRLAALTSPLPLPLISMESGRPVAQQYCRSSRTKRSSCSPQVFPSPQGPGDVGGHREERAIHNGDLAQELLELAIAASQIGQAAFEIFDQWLQQAAV